MSLPTRRRLTDEQMGAILTAIRAVNDPAALLPTVMAHVYDALQRHDGRRLADFKGQGISPEGWQIPATQWDAIAEAASERATVWGVVAQLRADLLDRMPGCFDDPPAPVGQPGNGVPARGWRLLCVSVRGNHGYLVGNPNVHPLDLDPGVVPEGVGTRFADLDAIKAYVRTELRGVSSYGQVRVIDDAGTVVMYGFRAGPDGTGERWTWRLAEPADQVPSSTDDTRR